MHTGLPSLLRSPSGSVNWKRYTLHTRSFHLTPLYLDLIPGCIQVTFTPTPTFKTRMICLNTSLTLGSGQSGTLKEGNNFQKP